jgi:N-acetylmuramoyl-L-alanine amidase
LCELRGSSAVRHHVLHQIQRTLLVISFLALFGIGAVVARIAGYGLPWPGGVTPQGLVMAAFDKQIALISGHAGYDSGAVCVDEAGNVTLTEADVNAAVTEQVAQRLRRAGADVTILEEYDARLQGLHADVLLSIHADSCIPVSGYKAAHHIYSSIPATENQILLCIDRYYAAATGLTKHPNTVTHNMTEYYAFNRIDPLTPAAIVELGFLGGDGELLTQDTGRVAKGIADSLLCFLGGGTTESTPTPAA